MAKGRPAQGKNEYDKRKKVYAGGDNVKNTGVRKVNNNRPRGYAS
jgi:hypothetical protein